jgi:hypothetical protein
MQATQSYTSHDDRPREDHVVFLKLGVREVWDWRKGRIQPYCLRGERYEPVARGEVLPGLDLELLTRFIEQPTTSAAIRGFRAALQS